MSSDCACTSQPTTVVPEEEEQFICSVKDETSPVVKPMLGLVYKKSSLWPEGKRFLKVKFLGDVSHVPNTLKRIKEIIEIEKDKDGPVMFWSQVCFINFQIVPPDEDAEIRIAMNGDKHYASVVGTDALNFTQDERTMSLGFASDYHTDEFVYRAVLHEFGHAIGFQHEHQSPQRKFEFDEENVKKDLRARGWTDEEIKKGFFDKITVDPESMDMLDVSDFDASSIMEYSMDASWLINYGGQGITEKNVLSATDILKALQAYSRF